MSGATPVCDTLFHTNFARLQRFHEEVSAHKILCAESSAACGAMCNTASSAWKEERSRVREIVGEPTFRFAA